MDKTNVMKINRIQLDRIKQGCECVFFISESGKKYKTEICKFCKRIKKPESN